MTAPARSVDDPEYLVDKSSGYALAFDGVLQEALKIEL